MTKSRLTISVLMVWVLVAAVYLSLFRGTDDWGRGLLILAFMALSLPWLLGPIRVFRESWVKIDAEKAATKLAYADFPASYRERILEVARELRLVGFVLRGSFRSVEVPFATGSQTIFECDKTGEVAVLTLVRAQRGIICKEVSVLFILSCLGDGTEMVTSDSTTPSVWPADLSRRGEVFPGLAPATRLVRVHRARLRGLGLIPQSCPGEARDICAFVLERERKSLERVADAGYYRFHEDAGVYRPTWKGAVLIAWRVTWPVPAIRLALRRWRALRALHALEREQPGCLDE